MKRLFESRWKFALFRPFARWISGLTYDCTRMSRLSSEALERRLTWRERFLRFLHFVICDGCLRYAAQVRFLRRAARHFAKEPKTHHHPLPSEARERLKRRLSQPPPDNP